MQERTLPGPLERTRRSPTVLLGVLVVALVTASMASVAERTVVRIQGEVSANWRGAYDLLVRPPGTHLDLERTNGVVEPNFIGFAGTGGISIEQLEAIRRIDGVEIAAPIGFVGFVHYVLSNPVVYLPAPPAEPTLYRIRLTATTNDGLRDLLVQRQSGLLLLGPGEGPQAIQRWATNFGSLSSGQLADGTIVYQLSSDHPLPAIASPLMAVDPAAEMALLGPTAEFLAPLAGIPPTSRTVGTFDYASIPDQYAFARTVLSFASRVENEVVLGRPVVPLVVSDRIYASLRLQLEVDRVGIPLTSYPPGAAGSDVLKAALAEAGPGTTPIGVADTDLTGSLRPLQLTKAALPWPGTTTVQSATAFSEFRDFTAGLPTRPQYRIVPRRPDSDATVAFEIAPLGVVGPDGEAPGERSSNDPLAPEITTGREAAYREFREVPLVAAEGYAAQDPRDQPFFFAPLGEFDLSKLEIPTEALSYVPFGAYDPPHTLWLGGAAAPSPVTSPRPLVEMSSTLNPRGLIMVPPLAITDLSGAVILRGDHPIDAVRVRVAGVSDFSTASRARIERVAEAILAMGLDVDIVAGSSPQPVDVFVPGYIVRDNGAADLGWIRQEWTTLGAAERVFRGLTGGALEILVIGLASAMVATAAVQAVRAATRRREVAILLASGWSNGNIRAWVMGEALISGIIVLGLGLVVWIAQGTTIPAGAAVVVVAFGVVAAPALGLHLTDTRIEASGALVQAGDVNPRTPRLPAARGPVTLGIRNVIASLTRSLILVLGLGAAASALSLVGGVVAEAGLRAGPTRLASAVLQIIEPSLLLTLAAAVAANAVALAAMWRLDARARAGEAAALIAAGWTRSQVLGTRLAAGAVLSLPAAAVGAAMSGATATAIGAASPVLIVAATIIISPILGVVGPLLVGLVVDPMQRP